MNFTTEQQQKIAKNLKELKDIPGIKQLFVCFEFTDGENATTVHSNPFDFETDSGIMLKACLEILHMAYGQTEISVVRANPKG